MSSIHKSARLRALAAPSVICSLVIASYPLIGNAQTLQALLAEAGHPEVQTCINQVARPGLKKAYTFQFPAQQRGQGGRDRAKAEAMLALVSDWALANNRTFLAFHPMQEWSACKAVRSRYLYWLSDENVWVPIRGAPAGYLRKRWQNLEDKRLGGSREFYVLRELQAVEYGIDAPARRITIFERCLAIIANHPELESNREAILQALINHYFNISQQNKQGRHYLMEYAHLIDEQKRDVEEVGPVYLATPGYPSKAVRESIEGWVEVEFVVTDNGDVTDIVVLRESHPGVFTKKALRATEQFKYLPGIVDGQPIARSGVKNRITFALTD